jgi:dTDP-4-amino-4,6-dideoxygalactose transaminase
MYNDKKLSLLKAKALSSKGLCLPSYPNITHQDLKTIIKRINDFIKKT